jgi:hypothetical protein
MKKVRKMKYFLKRVTISPWDSSQLSIDLGC